MPPRLPRKLGTAVSLRFTVDWPAASGTVAGTAAVTPDSSAAGAGAGVGAGAGAGSGGGGVEFRISASLSVSVLHLKELLAAAFAGAPDTFGLGSALPTAADLVLHLVTEGAGDDSCSESEATTKRYTLMKDPESLSSQGAAGGVLLRVRGSAEWRAKQEVAAGAAAPASPGSLRGRGPRSPRLGWRSPTSITSSDGTVTDQSSPTSEFASDVSSNSDDDSDSDSDRPPRIMFRRPMRNSGGARGRAGMSYTRASFMRSALRTAVLEEVGSDTSGADSGDYDTTSSDSDSS